jgi:hypothetical protein
LGFGFLVLGFGVWGWGMKGQGCKCRVIYDQVQGFRN